jgi:hypothetical protein
MYHAIGSEPAAITMLRRPLEVCALRALTAQLFDLENDPRNWLISRGDPTQRRHACRPLGRAAPYL